MLSSTVSLSGVLAVGVVMPAAVLPAAAFESGEAAYAPATPRVAVVLTQKNAADYEKLDKAFEEAADTRVEEVPGSISGGESPVEP